MEMLILKFIWKCKGPQTAKTVLEKKCKVREIKETLPFNTAIKRIKYLGINLLPKEAKDLYAENY